MIATTQRSTRLSDRLAWLLFGLTCAFTALDLVFLALSWATPVPDTWGFRGQTAILALTFAGVGQLLARHRPQNPIGWLFLVASLSGGITGFGIEYSTYVLLTRPGAPPGGYLAAWTASWLWFVWIGALMFVFLLFPTGRLPSERWRPVAWVVFGSHALMAFHFMFRPGPLYFAPYLDNPIAGSDRAVSLLTLIGGAGVALSALLVGVSIVLRLRRATGVERQQLKWFAYAAALVSVIGLINAVGTVGNSVGLPALRVKPFQFFTVAIQVAIPFTIGLAILRYRLYDIDLIIRRTLIYGALTGALALVYFGSVVLLQGLFRAVTGQQSEIAIIISTLAIAALFNPLRRRVQDGIDRRFYRRRYDAAKVIAAFSATVRDEVDLNKLTDRLLEVVEETMQPAHVSLWLRPSADGGPLTTQRGVKR